MASDRQIRRMTEQRSVIINNVDTTNNNISMTDQYGSTLSASIHFGDPVISVPKQGEEWVVERRNNDWFLKDKATVGVLPTLNPGDVFFTGDNLIMPGGNTYGNTVFITQANHGFTNGTVLYYTGSAYGKAKADSMPNSEVVGIVSSVQDANSFILTTSGLMTGLSGLTPGAVYFLDPVTAGALTTTEPTTAGQVSKPLLVAVSALSGFFINWRGNLVVSSVPSGAVFAHAATSAPSGYLICDGSSQLRATYPTLFTAIGTTYGSVDGTHFTLPDMRGRTVAGYASGGHSDVATIGNNDGSSLANRRPKHPHTSSHTLTLPNHGHSDTISVSVVPDNSGSGYEFVTHIPGANNYGTFGMSANFNTGGNEGHVANAVATKSGSVDNPTSNPAINGSVTVGSSGAANDAPSYIVLNYIIKI